MILTFVLIVAVTLAQHPSDVVHWTAVAPAGIVKPGENATIKITADIEPGWHLYALTQPEGGPRRIEIKAAKSSPFTVVTTGIAAPLPKVDRDPTFNLDSHYYDEKTTIDVPVAVPSTTPPGKRSVALEIIYQACSGRLCLRPATETLRVDVQVAKDRR